MMTTEELVTKLKGLGVDDEQAEGFRDLRLRAASPGGVFRVPVFNAEGKFYSVNAYFTDEDKDYVPLWDSVSEAGATV